VPEFVWVDRYLLKKAQWLRVCLCERPPLTCPKPSQARHTAALILKNNVITVAKLEPGPSNEPSLDITYIKGCCLDMLKSANRPLRQTAGTLAAAILAVEALDRWPELVRIEIC
jgi:hypothetical protein